MASSEKENLSVNNRADSKPATQKSSDEKPSKSTKAVWKSQNSALLINTLLKECKAGHQSDIGFKPVAWTACAIALKGSEVKSRGIAKTASIVWRKAVQSVCELLMVSLIASGSLLCTCQICVVFFDRLALFTKTAILLAYATCDHTSIPLLLTFYPSSFSCSAVVNNSCSSLFSDHVACLMCGQHFANSFSMSLQESCVGWGRSSYHLSTVEPAPR